MKNSDLKIQHQCPQCGAPATLLESDRLFSCAYCRVNSYLLTRGFSQYHLPHKSPDGQALIYFPYWRFKGMLFSCLADNTYEKFIDTSHQACSSTCFPVSLGLRSQALTLECVSPETEGYFISPQIKFQEVMTIFNRQFTRNLTQPLLHQAHIGETISLIYAPYYAKPALVDAVLNTPLPTRATDSFRLEDFPGGTPSARFQFIPAMCPNCGWDLTGSRDAQVLNCAHCHSLWQPGSDGFSAVPCAHIPTKLRQPVYLPFWRIKADVDGIDLNSYADLVRLANLPKVIQKDWESTRFHFWTPAFKVRPRVFLRLMRAITTAQLPKHLESRVPRHHCLTANLPVSEAMETLRVNLAGLINPKQRVAEWLPHIGIKPRKALLIYLPFEERTHELVHSALNLAVNKNQLSLAWNL